MPCNSDYLAPLDWEINQSAICCIEDELSGGAVDCNWWSGCHPVACHRKWSKKEMDVRVAAICDKLSCMPLYERQSLSLETQMWWRDHQEADRARLLEQEAKYTKEQHRASALKKLTKAERGALGL